MHFSNFPQLKCKIEDLKPYQSTTIFMTGKYRNLHVGRSPHGYFAWHCKYRTSTKPVSSQISKTELNLLRKKSKL